MLSFVIELCLRFGFCCWFGFCFDCDAFLFVEFEHFFRLLHLVQSHGVL